MTNPPKKHTTYLSISIALLAVIASAGGILLKGLYRDNAFVTTTWLGNDFITLFLAVPILVVSLVFAQRGSVRAQLVWLGALDYMLYNYAFYLFGAAFNAFFLIYAALLALSIWALILGLVDLKLDGIDRSVSEGMPVKWIGGYFLFVAIGLGFVYVVQSLSFVFTGTLPAIVTMSAHPTNVVFALDLTLLIPWLVIGALWLMKRKTWGFVIAGVINVKGPLYTLVLAVNSVLVFNGSISQTNELPLWGTLTGLGLIASGLFYANIRQKR